jgi:hypothetical protein
MSLWNLEWSWPRFALAFAGDAAAAIGQAPDMGVGVPFSAPWSWRAVALAQSCGMEAAAAGAGAGAGLSWATAAVDSTSATASGKTWKADISILLSEEAGNVQHMTGVHLDDSYAIAPQ